MQNRQLQTWLSEDAHASIDAEWKEQLALREELKDKPSELKRYEAKLRKTAGSLDAKCESLCEDTLEILHEVVTADPSLQLWFNRELDFALGSSIDANLSTLPHLYISQQ